MSLQSLTQKKLKPTNLFLTYTSGHTSGVRDLGKNLALKNKTIEPKANLFLFEKRVQTKKKS